MSTTPKITTNPVGVSYTTHQVTADNKWNVDTTTLITPVVPPVVIPPPVLAPIIPVNALNSGILDDSNNWKGDWDKSTPKTATGISKYIDSSSGRNYNVVYTNKAGFRFHNSFATVKAAVLNFCTDLYVLCDDWTQVQNLEIDMNQVLQDGRTVIMGIQAASGSKSWEYTTTPTGSSHWNKSNISVNPTTWKPGIWKHIRLFYSLTLAGIVTYIGVEVDGVYTPFANASGISAIALGWEPLGLLLCNFQQEGNTAKGIINIFAKQYQHFYW